MLIPTGFEYERWNVILPKAISLHFFCADKRNEAKNNRHGRCRQILRVAQDDGFVGELTNRLLLK